MADTKITALAAIGANPINVATFPIPMVDLLDNSMAASGTTKKVTVNQILGAGGTATLASATISGNLTVDTSTLKVDSANDWVGVGTATPAVRLHSNVADAAEAARFSSTSALLRFHPYVDATDKTRIQATNATNTGLSDLTLEGLNLRFNTNGGLAYAISNTGVSTWSVGGSTAMTLNANGLGVGEAASLSRFQARATTSDSSAYVFYGKNSAGNVIMFMRNDGRFVVGTGTVDNLIVTETGNVGIGAANPNISASGKALTISGAFTRSRLELQNTDGGTGGVTCGTISWFNGSNAIADITGAANSGSATLGSLAFSTGGSTRLTIDSSGNVISNVTGTAPTLATNSQMVFNLTSNTNLRISVRGTDGVTRTADITLA